MLLVHVNKSEWINYIFLLFMQIILTNPNINFLCIKLTHHLKANFD